jgi:hypothetical protein
VAKAKRIKNLDNLEKEIYRLKLEVKNYSERLSGRLDYLQQHYASMTANHFFCRQDDKKSSGKSTDKESYSHSWFENESFQDGLNSLLGRFAGRVAKGLDKLFSNWKAKKDPS